MAKVSPWRLDVEKNKRGVCKEILGPLISPYLLREFALFSDVQFSLLKITLLRVENLSNCKPINSGYY